MPIVAAAKRWRQFSWRRDIGVAVQNVTDLVRIFLVHARQCQLCEAFGSTNVKCFGRRLRLRACLMSHISSRNADQRRPQKCANQFPRNCTVKLEDHGATITLPFGFVKIVERIFERIRSRCIRVAQPLNCRGISPV